MGGEGSVVDAKTHKPFEYMRKKKTRHSREPLWRDGLSFFNLVEAAGVEPASEDNPHKLLQA